MSYQVIARKWRPQTFEEVTGQEAITQTLRNALEHDRLHHAYLFSGARGVGKTTTARLLAKALNCHKTDKPNLFPCSFNDETACASCKEISESRSIDVLEFDAASHTKVEEIRDIILESINISPARDRYKIFIIDEVHMLSTSSFNALLKTLEEPPPNVEFIMATTELHKVPATILSRCQEFEFRTIAVNKILERLKLIAEAEKVTISDEALKEIARSGEGSMRDAQSNFDQVISFSGATIEVKDVTNALGLASAEMLTRIANAIAENQPKEALLVVDELISRGQDLRSFCRDLLSFFRDLLIFKMSGDAENLLDTAVLNSDEMQKHAAPFSESDLIRFFNSLSETETKLKEATQTRYVLEIGLVKLIEMRRVVSLEKILERLAKLESAMASGSFSNDSPSVETFAEKKTLNAEISTKKYDFSPTEVPFSVSETRNSRFKTESAPAEIVIAETVLENDSPIAEVVEIVEEKVEKPIQPISLNDFSDEVSPFDNESFAPDFSEEITANGNGHNAISQNFLDSISIKLPPISSEDLAHHEDTKLDEAYENKLARLGDNLLPIRNASLIVDKLFAAGGATNPAETTNGTAAATVKAKRSYEEIIPAFSDDGDIKDLPILSENPTQAELLEYAHAHPSVRKALRIFRGKIIEIKKES